MFLSLTLLYFILQRFVTALVYDFEKDFLGVPNDRSPRVLRQNTDKLSIALQTYSSGNRIIIPANSTFYLMHGVYARDIHDVVIQVDGILKFVRHTDENVRHPYNLIDHHRIPGQPSACIQIDDSFNILLTSSTGQKKDNHSSDPAVIDGGGADWWGIPFVGYAQVQEKRPVLLYSTRVKNMTIEHIVFKDAPFYTLQLFYMDGLIVRHCSIVARRTNREGHSLLDLSAFNTDGIDVSGNNVHVHDVDIWNQDDCIAVKDNSTNMLFERIYASGLGLVIGSIGGSSIVQNITFRDSLVYKSYKGIYMKFREDEEGYGMISNILYDNIMIEEPIQWGLWIGPAQQSISSNICKANPCSLCWPQVPLSQCNPIKSGTFRNITLRNVVIHNPIGSPGVILADESNPIHTIIFENVTVTKGAMISSWMGRDIKELFRALDQPLEDHTTWMYSFYVIAGCLLIVFVCVVGAFIRHLIRASALYFSQEDSSWDDMSSRLMKRKLSDDNDVVLAMITRSSGHVDQNLTRRTIKPWRRSVQGLIISLMAFLLFAIHDTLMVLADRSNSSKFFVCKGVVNGFALANTWPVPHCFTDKTTNSAHRMDLNSNKINTILLTELGFFITILYIFWVCQKRNWLTTTSLVEKSLKKRKYELIDKQNRTRERSFTDTTGQISDSDISA